MTAEGEKVTIHRLHIHLEMGCTLGTIHQDGDIMGVSYLNNSLNGIHSTQNITNMRYTDDLSTRGNE